MMIKTDESFAIRTLQVENNIDLVSFFIKVYEH